ncbi:nuclear transport factor 2 family protein [Piscinibacter gummiphilus]|uniref:nuclear transport factor 2 family protein n=1 Tax=Piscinibacter gummiphilus TaxID=946333 RepID=UPI0039B8F1C0
MEHGPVTQKTADPRVARIVELFEHFTRDDVARLGEFYAAKAHFKDPFNDVRGLSAVQQVFRHMFDALDEPRFVVRDVIVQGDQCFLSWDFLFRFKRYREGLQTVHGGSQLQLDAIGLILHHRDYWDAAEELYEKLPLVGSLMRWLKKRASG